MANIDPNQVSQARNLLEGAKSIAILLGGNSTYDSVAAGLSLYLALSSYGKQVSIASPTPMTVAFNRLVATDKIGTSVNGTGGKNLVISFPYQEGSIEKVSYNIENDSFNLVIEPREGYPMITQDLIRYSFSGGATDVIITVGVANLNDLGDLYRQNQQLFSEKSVINIDTSQTNTRFANRTNIIGDASGVCELMTSLFSSFGFTIDSDIATNLLAGIESGSNNFTTPGTTAATFEAAAICLKNGAKRITAPSHAPSVSQYASPFPPQPTFSRPFRPQAPAKPQIPQAASQKPKREQPQQPTRPFAQNPQQTKSAQTPQAPPDWLKPKIFKGSTLL